MYVAGRKKSLVRGRGRGWLIPAEEKPCLTLAQVVAMTGAVRYITALRQPPLRYMPYPTSSSKGYPLETRGR
jgi:hypothetical protein